MCANAVQLRAKAPEVDKSTSGALVLAALDLNGYLVVR